MERCPYITEFLTLFMSKAAFSGVISEVTEIYKQVRIHTVLQMYKRKFISIKYMRRYSYAKFETFFCATRYNRKPTTHTEHI